MSSNLDDTQPRSPFKNPPGVQPFRRIETEQPFTYEEEPEVDGVPPLEPTPRRSAGCLPLTVIGLIALGFAGMLILLAGFAGWTTGTRTAQTNATATRGAVISEQISRFPADAASRNFYAMEVRLSFLATLTPGVPGVAEFAGTATAVFQTAQPTATAQLTATLPATQTLTAQVAEGTPAPTGPDLAALLTQAQSDLGVQNWEPAIETLQLIESTDPTFQRELVRGQLFTALTSRALGLLRSPDIGDMAEGVRLTDLAADYGDISVSEVNYEAYIAGLYLNARSAIGLDYSRAIQSLSVLYNTAPNYRDVGQLLFSQYVGYGDAWTAQAQWCAAVSQYQSALTLFNDVGVTSKLSAAQAACQSAPLGGTPGGTSPFPGITPVGVG